ncbi:MAG: Tellurium resistance protein TerA [Rickettsiales bacterium]|nr:Tellurium resistance protein TerA [Rickettsiales bacterium]|tara:strand:- start:705 stop:1451 length:747 start_codon:yes stop_codon:yes gene_type:complete
MNEKKSPDAINPLLETPDLETRDNAAGLKGKSLKDLDSWEKMVQKRDIRDVFKGSALNLECDKTTGFDTIRFQLEWERPKPQGFFNTLKDKLGKGQDIDLDLGCIYEMKDGTAGVIQPLGDLYGAFNKPPFIELSGDDRTGADEAGENLKVNGTMWPNIKRIVVYAYIYDGSTTWSQTKAKLHIWMKGQDPVNVNLEQYEDGLPVCVIAKLENVDNNIQIKNVNEYYPGHAEMDRAFGFGINWEEGRK